VDADKIGEDLLFCRSVNAGAKIQDWFEMLTHLGVKKQIGQSALASVPTSVAVCLAVMEDYRHSYEEKRLMHCGHNAKFTGKAVRKSN
jgi:hypothetical protein